MGERTIQLDQAQPGGVSNSNAIPPFAPYRARHISQRAMAATTYIKMWK